MINSSNPVLNDQDSFAKVYGKDMFLETAQPEVATLSGVVNKTGLLVLIAVVAGGLAYALIPAQTAWPVFAISAFVAFGICIGMGFVMRGNPRLSAVIAPLYAIVEGVLLGVFTKMLDAMLISYLPNDAFASLGVADLSAGGFSLALPAFLITVIVVLSMLGLYSTGIIKPTARFKAVVITATMGVMLLYLISWPLEMFGVSIPYLSLNSAMQGGTPALIGLGINALILGIASLMLIIDFGRVQDIVRSGQPKYMEWYASFGLLVTLAWIYYEAVKLSFRLALLFAARD